MIKFVSYKMLKKINKLVKETFTKVSNAIIGCTHLPKWFLSKMKFNIMRILNKINFLFT